LLRDPQLEARDFFVEVEHPDLGRSFLDAGAPYRLSETPWRLRTRAPLLGEHNEAIYAGDLGLTANELETLRRSNTI
jgi:crotonobetainyl-CoA:carnitine CoA-transferase CaiB-like acyl-CoA transferase